MKKPRVFVHGQGEGRGCRAGWARVSSVERACGEGWGGPLPAAAAGGCGRTRAHSAGGRAAGAVNAPPRLLGCLERAFPESPSRQTPDQSERESGSAGLGASGGARSMQQPRQGTALPGSAAPRSGPHPAPSEGGEGREGGGAHDLDGLRAGGGGGGRGSRCPRAPSIPPEARISTQTSLTWLLLRVRGGRGRAPGARRAWAGGGGCFVKLAGVVGGGRLGERAAPAWGIPPLLPLLLLLLLLLTCPCAPHPQSPHNATQQTHAHARAAAAPPHTHTRTLTFHLPPAPRDMHACMRG